MHARIRKDWTTLAGPVVMSFLTSLEMHLANADTAAGHLGVDAAVASNCTIESTAVDFPSYDPLVANAVSPLDGTGTLTVKCTIDSSATILLGQGSFPTPTSTDAAPERRMSDGAGHFLSYVLFVDSARITLWGNTAETGRGYIGNGSKEILVVHGRIPGGQDAEGGMYDDTVIATITF